jgi:hypothetical protein
MEKIQLQQTQGLSWAPYGASITNGTISKIDKREVLNTNIAQNIEMRKLSPSAVLTKRLPFLAFALIVGIVCVHESPMLDLKAFGVQILASVIGAYAILEARHSISNLLVCIAIFAGLGLYLATTVPFYTFATISGTISIMMFTIIAQFFLGQESKNTYYLPTHNYYVWFANTNISEAIYYIVAVFFYVSISFLKA